MRSNRIQSLLNTYLERFGSINLLLPDEMALEIGITQQSKHGDVKMQDYCWVVTKRGTRSSTLDRYSMSMSFDEDEQKIVDNADRGTVYII